MPANKLIEGDILITELRHAISQGGLGLGAVPNLLKRILAERLWRERIIQQTGEVIEFESFVEFVTTPPLEGLGATIPLIERMCKDDPEVRNLLDQEITKAPGAPIGNLNASKTNNDNIMNCSDNGAEQGTSFRYALRRLRRQRPDLHRQVLQQEMSAHAAMIQAGFREKRVSIPVDPERAAASIKRHFEPEQIKELIDYLTD